jgi:hypothetical protein
MIYLDLTVLGWVLMIWLELVRSTFMKRKVCTRHIFHFYSWYDQVITCMKDQCIYLWRICMIQLLLSSRLVWLMAFNATFNNISFNIFGEFGMCSVRFIQWFLTKIIKEKTGDLKFRIPVYSGSGFIRIHCIRSIFFCMFEKSVVIEGASEGKRIESVYQSVCISTPVISDHSVTHVVNV